MSLIFSAFQEKEIKGFKLQGWKPDLIHDNTTNKTKSLCYPLHKLSKSVKDKQWQNRSYIHTLCSFNN